VRTCGHVRPDLRDHRPARLVTLLLREAEVDGLRVDVLVRGGRIVAVSAAGTGDGGAGADVVDCRGGALLPGLHDHHLHLHALAAARRSVRCPADHVALAGALRTAEADAHGWVRGVGYPGDDLDARVLDRLHAERPVRIQHRSGAMWVLNSAALARIGPPDHPGVELRDGVPTGRIFRADDWLRTRLPAADPPDLRGLGVELAGLGLTALTDATPDLTDADSLAVVPQRLTLLGVPLGIAPPEGVSAGPYKIVLADSGLPGLDELVARIQAAHAVGRPVAVHAVTRESLVLLLVALREAGTVPGDRIEHAAVVPAELLGELHGLAVVTQPGFLGDRGDLFRRETPVAEHVDLYRCRSLLDAGVPLALSSDAPYGPVDPWAVIAAATTRSTPDGTPLGPQETITAAEALDRYLAPAPGAPPRRLAGGTPADLVLLDVPLRDALRSPSAEHVHAVWIDGTRWR
jgi:predicted amidohydrolase YtcJ